MTWEVKEIPVKWDKEGEMWKGRDDLDKALDEGWEPYAVVPDAAGVWGHESAHFPGPYIPETIAITRYRHFLRRQRTDSRPD